jgi:hypothetical protein
MFDKIDLDSRIVDRFSFAGSDMQQRQSLKGSYLMESDHESVDQFGHEDSLLNSSSTRDIASITAEECMISSSPMNCLPTPLVTETGIDVLEVCVNDENIDSLIKDGSIQNHESPSNEPDDESSESDYEQELINSIESSPMKFLPTPLVSKEADACDFLDADVADIDLESLVDCESMQKDSSVSRESYPEINNQEEEIVESVPVSNIEKGVDENDTRVNDFKIDINDPEPPQEEESIGLTPSVDASISPLPQTSLTDPIPSALQTLLNLATSPTIQSFSSLESHLKQASRALQVIKLGEATFAEVFKVSTRGSVDVAMKLVPFGHVDREV